RWARAADTASSPASPSIVVPAKEAVAKRQTSFDEDQKAVVPAQAGTQFSCCNAPKLGSRLRGNDGGK
ncbi:MAG: hypothetical protein Q8R69_18255, partial [Telluria sp.]|nr:hypothetical protein [Telluria sp.]